MNLLRRAAYFVLYRLALCYWFVFRPTTLGSYVAVWWQERVLIIKNSYKSGYTLPCGGLKSGETTTDAAVRELHEEVGLEVPAERFQLVGRFTSLAEFKTDECDVFEVFFDKEPTITVDQHEVISAKFIRLEEVQGLQFAEIVRQYFVHKNEVLS